MNQLFSWINFFIVITCLTTFKAGCEPALNRIEGQIKKSRPIEAFLAIANKNVKLPGKKVLNLSQFDIRRKYKVALLPEDNPHKAVIKKGARVEPYQIILNAEFVVPANEMLGIPDVNKTIALQKMFREALVLEIKRGSEWEILPSFSVSGINYAAPHLNQAGEVIYPLLALKGLFTLLRPGDQIRVRNISEKEITFLKIGLTIAPPLRRRSG